MPHIALLSSSIRAGRKSHRVVLYFKNYLESNNLATVDVLDLKVYNFPLFDERLRLQKQPSVEMLDFADKVKSADGILIVTPEYNGGYPASLKNAIDLLYAEWRHKPVAFATVSEGAFGGAQVITSLQFTLWKIGASTVSASFPVPNISTAFDEAGNSSNPIETDKRAAVFIKELFRIIELKAGVGD